MTDYDVDIYVTGSNSRMMSSKISTYLTGRYVSFRIYPLSFSEYLTSIRLQNACRLLLSTNLRVVVISEMVGYNDYHYFSNTFKKHFLMTPLQYRKIKDGGDLQ